MAYSNKDIPEDMDYWDGVNSSAVQMVNYLLSSTDVEESKVWMQFTGLCDRDGKEIYEGDVVRYENAGYDPSEGETPWEIGTVIFKNLAWMIDSDDYMLCDFTLTDLEVIGNIYENPELLRVESTFLDTVTNIDKDFDWGDIEYGKDT